MNKNHVVLAILGAGFAMATAAYAMNHDQHGNAGMKMGEHHMMMESGKHMSGMSMHSNRVMQKHANLSSPMHQELFNGMQAMHDAMHQGMMLKDPDAAFAAGMVPHHEGAIVMAQVELKYGKDPEMRALAQKIIDAQDPEIKQMNAWLAKNPEKAKEVETNHNAPMQAELMQGMQEMHDAMHQGMMSQDPDVAFAAGMIPHHEGAIAMARVQLKYGKDAEMLALAKEIIAAQGPEIEQMKAWLAKNASMSSGQHHAEPAKHHGQH